MSQAIHIFKKDVRHLRLEIAIAIFGAAAFAFIEVRHALWVGDPIINGTPATYLAWFLLPLAWWTLIGRAIHDEALPGDRQFWITRPYSWRSLLGAKALLIFAFVNIPVAIAHIVILRAYGLPLGPSLPGLLWSQLLLTIVFLLPIFALSAITNGFAQLVLAILAPCVIALILYIVHSGVRMIFSVRRPEILLGDYAGSYEWVKFCIVFLVVAPAAVAILLWQYARRGTIVARFMAGATTVAAVLILAFTPWTTAFGIQAWLTKQHLDMSSARADFVSDDKSLTRVFRNRDQIDIGLAFRMAGFPAIDGMQVEGFFADFVAQDGSKRHIEQLPTWAFANWGQHFSLWASVDDAYYKKVKDEPLTVRGELYLTLYGHRQSTHVPFDDSAVTVPRVGVCSASETTNRRNYFVTCNSAFRYPSALVSYRFLESATDLSRQELPFSRRRIADYSPFPADVGISPVYRDEAFASGQVQWELATVDTMEALDHVRLKFEINNLHLSDFEVHPKPMSSSEINSLRQKIERSQILNTQHE
jgi:hypothetical protein